MYLAGNPGSHPGPVSIPFSSGWALQSKLPGSSSTIRSACFNSLFIGMGFAIIILELLRLRILRFQFPFHRDGLCNFNIRVRESNICHGFNSLFIGMGFAIITCLHDGATGYLSFNSLFIGMGFAISIITTSQHVGAIGVSIPFSSGWALQYCSRRCSQWPRHGRSVSIPFSSGWALQ